MEHASADVLNPKFAVTPIKVILVCDLGNEARFVVLDFRREAHIRRLGYFGLGLGCILRVGCASGYMVSSIHFRLDALEQMLAQLGLYPLPWPMTIGEQARYGVDAVGALKSDLGRILDVLVSRRLLQSRQKISKTNVSFDTRVVYEYEDEYGLTTLGYEFVTACRKPKRKEP